jgi:glycosyltransferase involved in cell wall biosynthesis
MRVLVLHSKYLSGPASGENRVVEDEVRLLRGADHDVIEWQPEADPRGAAGLVRSGIDTVWSTRAVAHVERLMRRVRPDVVHVHNLFPSLSPAVIRTAHAGGAATAMTLHNYRSMCLPATLLRDGAVCEACVGKVPWRGVAYRCYRDSLPGSGALATSLVAHRAMRSFQKVDVFLAISRFVREKHIEAGLPPDRIAIKSNFAWPTARRDAPGDYFVYAGRLAPEKGLDHLITAWRQVDAPLLIVGDGPERDRLQRLAGDGVEFRPAVEADEVARLMSGSRAVLVPSVWHEPAGKVVLEAYAAGVPVIASEVGALPEFVDDDVTGFLVSSRDPEGWRIAAHRLLDDARNDQMGAAAFAMWQERFAPSIALDALLSVYERALRSRSTAR